MMKLPTVSITFHALISIISVFDYGDLDYTNIYIYIRAGWYMQFVRYIDIFLINDTV